MHDESTVSVKVYLIEGDTTVEIRRFEVDQAVITNYDYVRERLQMAIPKLRENIFKLLWQDADGDEVTISSDEELMIALSELKSNVCKFIARLPSTVEEKEPHFNINIPNIYDMFSAFSSFADTCPIFEELQGDVTCHACQQPISGIRYRCLECVQYYQCGECEYKKTHPDHIMLRLIKSSTISNMIPKCMQILKSHFIRGSKCVGMNANTFFREKMGHHGHGEKDKSGGHHRRRFRRHCHFSGNENKSTNPTEEATPECPYSDQMINNLGNIVGAFLGMYKDTAEKPNETENITTQSTVNTSPIKTVDIDAGPAMPSAPEDEKMQEDSSVPSTSTTDTQKDSKINMALELLTEMGFNDENRWLSRLLEHFDGDIAKTIDHLTLGK